jgi:hypothetical protein
VFFKRFFKWGGVAAGAILVAFGIAALVLSINGGSTVNSNLKQEYIVGTPDMTPAAIAPEVQDVVKAQNQLAAAQTKAGVPAAQRFTFTHVTAPSCSVAGKLVDGGSRARCFAEYMRIHALGASSGLTYSQMGRFIAKPGTPITSTDFLGGTSDPKYALVDARTKQPVSNGRRDLWVTETALTSALNLAYTAAQISLFGIVVGVALLLSGIGFAVLALGGALRDLRLPKLHRSPETTVAGGPTT